MALTNVGRIYHDWGQWDRAGEAYREAIEVSDRTDFRFGQAYARLNLGELHLDRGEFADVERLFRASLEHYEDEDSGIPPGDALGGRVLNSLGLGRAHAMADDHEAARASLTEALAVARERDQRPIAPDILAALVEFEEVRGDPASALSALQAHVALRDSIFDQGAFQRVSALEAEAEIERRERENLLLREEQRVREAVLARQRLVTFLAGGLFLSAVLLAGVLAHFSHSICAECGPAQYGSNWGDGEPAASD